MSTNQGGMSTNQGGMSTNQICGCMLKSENDYNTPLVGQIFFIKSSIYEAK